MKQILELTGLAGCALGFLGGILVCLLCGDYWFIAIGIGVLGYTAFPRCKGWWDDLNCKFKTLRKEDA
jgi:hypothetical protein